MAQPLVSLSEVQQFLELEDTADPDLLQALTLSTTRLLERLCGRERFPFSDPIAGRIDILNGSGSSIVVLPYPIATLTSLKLGYNPAAPLETLVVNDTNAVLWGAGSRIIERVDGGLFGTFTNSRYVHVTYNTADDRPEDAKLAVMRAVAQVYRQRGSEDASSENVSGYNRTMAYVAATDPLWTEFVRTHRHSVFL